MKSGGDFSIGNAVWPGTSKLLEEMGELQQVCHDVCNQVPF
jgi:hypothetical protein